MNGGGRNSRSAGNEADTSQEVSIKHALLFVVTLAAVTSLVPLAINKSGSVHSPLLVAAGMETGNTIYCLRLRRSLSTSQCKGLSISSIVKRCQKDLGVRCVIAALLVTLFARISYAAFAGSTVFLDTAVSASLYETWPMLSIIVVYYVDKARRQVPSTTLRSTYGLLLVGVLAAVLIIMSSGISILEISGSTFGLLLALLAPITGALIAVNHLFSYRVLYGREPEPEDDWTSSKIEEFGAEDVNESIRLVGMILTASVLVPVLVVIDIAYFRELSASKLLAFVGGLLISLLGSVIHRSLGRYDPSHDRREIAAIQYLAPLLSLLWLYVFVGINVAHIGWLVLGTIGVVVVNILFHFDPERYEEDPRGGKEQPKTSVSAGGLASTTSIPGSVGEIQQRFGLKALLASLLLIGAAVYIRDDIVSAEEFTLVGSYYWQILAVIATVFTFLYAFRLNRVETLISTEDYYTLRVVRSVESLPGRVFHPVLESASRETVLAWISNLSRASKTDDYKRTYEDVYGFFRELMLEVQDQRLQLSPDLQRQISEIRTDLDALAHGRQQARESTERVALWLLGGGIVVFSFFAPTAPVPFLAIMGDLAAILLGSVVVFLLFHMADISRSRANELLKNDPDRDDVPDGPHVRFRDSRDTTPKRVLSIAIVLGIVVALACLLAWDHL